MLRSILGSAPRASGRSTLRAVRSPQGPRCGALLGGLGLALLLAGCGQRGPLYLPGPADASAAKPDTAPNASPRPAAYPASGPAR